MMNPGTLSDSIQLAVAPVFLLTAVAGMIGALTQRLARVIDRARVIHKEMSQVTLKDSAKEAYQDELKNIMTRGRFINVSMIFLVLCAIMIGLTVLELFFAETSSGKLLVSSFVLYTFVSGIASFIFALISLLFEVLIASYSIRWKPHD
ncbi:DUF2721 domain-containing protein [Polynucleobacter sp. 30F-ANTBAC]|jgi:Protein of unknown function (DUF2721)|uniref:DUF2721 domain-containing protein n=1 Tax=Polynucleobacter sp. 30F-ANTBAC TaxID=2689095 RepID=UPI001C0D216A|nr:DUF2721 domain-containing protein [Polynucleobacter sp. 30F-ANTBAC]MBU3598991.1 DUF2721 domain-containing protein [Polynucleobacter sp. 30F-ANTBAC]